MITDPQRISTLLMTTIYELYQKGKVDFATLHPDLSHTCKNVFGVGPEAVAGVHTRRHGTSDGIWFRLKDGRVLDETGDECAADPALYDTVDN